MSIGTYCTFDITALVRLVPGLIASLDLGIAKAPSRVDVPHVRRCHEALDEVLLFQTLEADHVHAHLSAVVASREPVPARVAEGLLVAGPGDPVTLASKREVAD